MFKTGVGTCCRMFAWHVSCCLNSELTCALVREGAVHLNYVQIQSSYLMENTTRLFVDGWPSVTQETVLQTVDSYKTFGLHNDSDARTHTHTHTYSG